MPQKQYGPPTLEEMRDAFSIDLIHAIHFDRENCLFVLRVSSFPPPPAGVAAIVHLPPEEPNAPLVLIQPSMIGELRKFFQENTAEIDRAIAALEERAERWLRSH